ncbi:hypothetical protein [Pandoraea sp. PE-S2T-3]|uniref:hypothetical protein n=1 Tax=Pandoraea sp. PE-S2T-3 TaxID=1986993 RepID=UPI001125069D|nr:hypothetical protein [Pandoraea sp. PE-S2T-3]
MSEHALGVGAPRGSTPVLIRHVTRPFDDAGSLAGDIAAVGQAPPKLAGKAWVKYPERTYRTPDGDVCVSFGEWAKQREGQEKVAQGIKADASMPDAIRNTLGTWNENFVGYERAVLMSEFSRYRTLLRAGKDELVHTTHLRAFGVDSHIKQLGAISALDDAVNAAEALVKGADDAPDGVTWAETRQHLSDLRDKALDTTEISLRSRLALLDRELAEVKVLNELTTVAQRERLTGGERVPLRLARRGDRYVLKPAATRSVFASKQRRARIEAASLSLLLGLPASTAITLDGLRDRGFGCQENTFLLADAPIYEGDGDGRQWVLARARDLMYWKDEATRLLAVVDDVRAGRCAVDVPCMVPDDAKIDDTPAVTFEARPEEQPEVLPRLAAGLHVRRWSTDGNEAPRTEQGRITPLHRAVVQVHQASSEGTVAYGTDVDTDEEGDVEADAESEMPSDVEIEIERAIETVIETVVETTDNADAGDPPRGEVDTTQGADMDVPPPLPKSPPPPRYDRFGHLVNPPLSKAQREKHEWISALCRPLAVFWDTEGSRDKVIQHARLQLDLSSGRPPAIAGRCCRIASNLISAKTDPFATRSEARRADFERLLDVVDAGYALSEKVIHTIVSRVDLLNEWVDGFEQGPVQKRVRDMATETLWRDFGVALFEDLDRCRTPDDLSGCLLKAAECIDPVDIAYQSLVVPTSKPGARDALTGRQRLPGEAGT